MVAEAKAKGHSTTQEAIDVGVSAQAKHILLTHFRYILVCRFYLNIYIYIYFSTESIEDDSSMLHLISIGLNTVVCRLLRIPFCMIYLYLYSDIWLCLFLHCCLFYILVCSLSTCTWYFSWQLVVHVVNDTRKCPKCRARQWSALRQHWIWCHCHLRTCIYRIWCA